MRGAISSLRARLPLPLSWRLLGTLLMKEFARAYPRARFVEIGANDGEFGSALRPFVLAREWTGVMVEPSPRAFARLRENYRELDRVALENAAIADHDGRATFYEIAEQPAAAATADRAAWEQALGSLDRDQLLGLDGFVEGVEERIVSTEVRCLTFDSLCERHRIEALDLLVVDTEGHDLAVLRQVDLGTIRPRLLVYEHLHLAPDEREACDRLVAAAGYEQKREFFDTFCLDASVDDRLTRRFRALRPALAPVYASP